MVIEEKDRIGSLLKYELDKNYCREVVTIASGQNLKMGTVLGLSNGKYTAAVNCTTVGDVNASGDLAITGNLSITGGTVSITGGTSATTTEDEVETTTITGGTIAVTGGTCSISGATLGIDDGTLSLSADRVFASAVLLEDVDATSADKKALVLKRACIVDEGSLIFPISATNDDKAKYVKDLSRSGILVRKSC